MLDVPLPQGCLGFKRGKQSSYGIGGVRFLFFFFFGGGQGAGFVEASNYMAALGHNVSWKRTLKAILMDLKTEKEQSNLLEKERPPENAHSLLLSSR